MNILLFSWSCFVLLVVWKSVLLWKGGADSKHDVAFRDSAIAALPGVAATLVCDLVLLWPRIGVILRELSTILILFLLLWLVVGPILIVSSWRALSADKAKLPVNLIRIGHGLIWLGSTWLAIQAFLGV